jgi:hypothetical protein
MAQATLTRILDEIKTLEPEELKEVERAARALREPAEKEAEREAVLQILEETGLVAEIKRPPMDMTQERKTVPIQGKPLSETIIEERR